MAPASPPPSPFNTDPNAYRLDWPGDARFGPGCVKQLAELLNQHRRQRVLVVTDAGIVASGLLVPVLDDLRVAGLTPEVFDGVEPNPSLANVDAALVQWREHDADALVAFGGGSAIDAAKLLAARLASDAPIERLLSEGDAAITRAVPFFVAVPTTAGTGSESTLAALVKDEQGKKRVMRSAAARPRHVLLDPALTLSVPRSVTAATGFDVAMHALGAATNRAHNPVGLALAQQALAQAVEWLPRVLDDPRSLPARSAMLQASHLAGLAIGMKGVDAIHGLTTPLESVAHAPHAHVLAVVMEPVMRFTAETESARHATLARACGWPDGDLIERLVSLRERCGLPRRLMQFELSASDLPPLITPATEGPSTRLHARPLRREDVAMLYHSML